MKEAVLNLEIDYKKLILLIPVFSFFGNWFIMSIYITFLLFFFILNHSFQELSNIKIPKLFVWCILLAWGIYVLFESPERSEGIKYYYYLFIVPFILFVVINTIKLDLKFLDTFINSFIILACVLSIISIFKFFDSGFSMKTKISPIWTDYNIVSAFFMIVFMFNFSIIFNSKKDQTLILKILSCSLILFGIFLTQTRGVWLSIIIAVLFYIVKRPKVLIPALVSTGVVISTLILVFPTVVTERFLSVKNFGTDVSSLGRLQAWFSSIELIRNNPLFGYGFDSYIHLRDQVFGFYFVLVVHSHNTYLRAIVEMGLIGFFLYFYFFFLAMYYSFKLIKLDKEKTYRKYLDGLQLSFVGLIVSFMFEPYFSLFGLSAFIIWLLISILFNLESNYKNYFKTS